MNVTADQLRECMAAACEVLNGASQQRVLEIADKIVLARQILALVVSSKLTIGQPAEEEVPEPQQVPRAKLNGKRARA